MRLAVLYGALNVLANSPLDNYKVSPVVIHCTHSPHGVDILGRLNYVNKLVCSYLTIWH